ncbi:hypothetical protein LBMAG18_00410 [Alphaproteobacteria bacterium]|nr:hypothetical protein LBMAG18_00410 [Alphaproteobacteria bacterium]
MDYNSNSDKKPAKLWILADDRPGTFSQSLALAQALKIKYEIIKIDYNFFSKLPNFLLKLYPLHFNRNNLKQLVEKTINNNLQPQIIISAGRKASLIGIFLKKKFEKTKLIQIMQPEINYNKFDIVILPNHDKPKYKKGNILYSVGALNQINPEIIIENKEKFKKIFNKINQKIVVLLVGGNSKKNYYDKKSVIKLCHETNNFVKKLNCQLLILNSRRTSPEITQLIKKNINCQNIFFEWDKVKNNNPYLASIGFADYFIATGDSVSMISECCSSGRPVFIFDQKKISSKKHRIFHQELYKNGYAFPLNNIENYDLKSFYNMINELKVSKLNEAYRISKEIIKKFNIH